MDGRPFTIRIDAPDPIGNAGFATAIVSVPHDQGSRTHARVSRRLFTPRM